MDLASELILNLIDYGIDLDYGKAQEVADKLLIRAEKNGMSPPKFDELVEIQKNGKSLAYLFSKSGWEPEDV